MHTDLELSPLEPGGTHSSVNVPRIALFYVELHFLFAFSNERKICCTGVHVRLKKIT